MKSIVKPEDTLYHLTLLRHGESLGNAQRLLQGQVDFELSAHGRQQSQRLADRWVAETIHFEQIVSSPLSRARQTAEIIAKALNSPLEFHPDWMERDFGSLSGRVLSEAELKILRDEFKDPYAQLGGTGESQWDAFHRAERAIASLLDRPPGHYLVVAHGGIINQALHVILDLPPRKGSDGPRFILSNACFASLTYSSTEKVWRLSKLNDNQHLEGLFDNLIAPSPEAELSAFSPDMQASQSLQAKPLLSYHIRPALPNDLDGLLEVFAEVNRLHADARPDIFNQPSKSHLTRPYFEALLTQPDTYLLVTEAGGEIVGGLHAVVNETPQAGLLKPRRWLNISNITVKSVYRNQGIGRALMQQALSLAKQLNLQAVELSVWEFNDGSRHFYESLGYRTSRRVMWIEIE
jgi:broad specificity phosphatase PhoE/ribosomal protein S18 acetylase RimI-like enzyme